MNPQLCILVVDDDRSMTRTLADILTMAGHEVVEAWSGAEALEKAQKKHFNCVVTDFRMEGMNGVELHQKLRQVQPGLPVVLITAYAADVLVHRGLDEGVVGVFDKPLEINNLLGFLASLAKNRVVAIVDDDPAFCKTLADVLRLRGFNVKQVCDPHTDVEVMAEGAQVILLDMKLNGFTGLDVLKALRKKHPTLPVLLVTGYQQQMAAVIESALEIDAFTCLYKPLDIPALLDTLSNLQLERLRSAFKGQ
jgi:two-component system response regulator HydG